jgi:hypothetical protein
MGDLIEHIAMHATELGIGVIETTHSFTEQPAMKTMADMLGKRFHDVEFRVFKSGAHAMKEVTFAEMTETIANKTNGCMPQEGAPMPDQQQGDNLKAAMEEFKDHFPQLWQRVELVMRIQRLQQDLGGEFPSDRMILHLIAPLARELMLQKIRVIDLASGTVVLDVYEYNEIMAGTVFIPLDLVGWFGAPNIIEHQELGFSVKDLDQHRPSSASSAAESSIIKRIRKTNRIKRKKNSDSQNEDDSETKG